LIQKESCKEERSFVFVYVDIQFVFVVCLLLAGSEGLNYCWLSAELRKIFYHKSTFPE